MLSGVNCQFVSLASSLRRIPSNTASSNREGRGSRTYSQPSRASSVGTLSTPVAMSRQWLGRYHGLVWVHPPRTLWFPCERMCRRSHASMGCSCTGVAVASNRLLVRGPISRRKAMSLFGSPFSSISAGPASTLGTFLRRARCASSTMTQV